MKPTIISVGGRAPPGRNMPTPSGESHSPGAARRFSRSSCFSRVRSSGVSPGRRPASRSAWRTQLRNVYAVQPIFSAMEVIAAHWDLCFSYCSSTVRNARSRTSGENEVFTLELDLGRYGMNPARRVPPLIAPQGGAHRVEPRRQVDPAQVAANQFEAAVGRELPGTYAMAKSRLTLPQRAYA